mmetsp:Transcript_7959/g.9471  ORF Transcript_7959/g.9471 Transcript_7959/m.9471 type:complete len:127 (+) Transcript_7959:94-474(+)
MEWSANEFTTQEMAVLDEQEAELVRKHEMDESHYNHQQYYQQQQQQHYIQNTSFNLHATLKRFWGFDIFRPHQEEVANALLSERDVLVLMATGSGKSLCFQVPAASAYFRSVERSVERPGPYPSTR